MESMIREIRDLLINGNETCSLEDYINKHYKTKAEFARENNTDASMTSVWIKRGYIVHNGQMYSLRRKLKEIR